MWCLWGSWLNIINGLSTSFIFSLAVRVLLQQLIVRVCAKTRTKAFRKCALMLQMLESLESLEIKFAIKSPGEQICREKIENLSLIEKYNVRACVFFVFFFKSRCMPCSLVSYGLFISSPYNFTLMYGNNRFRGKLLTY